MVVKNFMEKLTTADKRQMISIHPPISSNIWSRKLTYFYFRGFYFGRENYSTKKCSNFYVTRQILLNDKGRPTKSRNFIACLSSALLTKLPSFTCYNNNNRNNNTRFIERHGAIASEALADRSSQLARNRREKMSFKSSFK